MKKTAIPYLQDILYSINQINGYVETISHRKEIFDSDVLVQDAIIRRLEVIGEATKRLEKDFREEYNHIPWKQMAGLRDVLIHEYDEVDLEQIWIVIKQDLPLLLKEINHILNSD